MRSLAGHVTALSPASSAFYHEAVDAFARVSVAEVLGHLSLHSEYPIETSQRDAWHTEIELLQASLADINGHVFFEFTVPRIGSRIDAAVVCGAAIIVLEFKVGAKDFLRSDESQVLDYALDLKNFHRASHGTAIVPVLVATEAASQRIELGPCDQDGVYRPVRVNAAGLRELLVLIAATVRGPTVDPVAWSQSSYCPTPTIIQAAQRLYANHGVDAITRNDAGAEHLARTTGFVESVVERTCSNGGRSIVFVTGVPGAGKTLVGLNLATRRRAKDSPTHAVYLSGNGPLVKVLREALTRDEVARLRSRRQRKTKAEVGQPIKAFIQNVHHFRDAALRDGNAPADHVVIFDEAQRAWDRAMTSQFMRQKKGQPNFDASEPEFLISYLDRHPDWAVVVCLVGGGQEINRGEAGISEWLDAVRTRFPHWQVYAPGDLLGPEYAATRALELLRGSVNFTYEPALHLAVSMRSFRSERVSSFVHALLECEEQRARELLQAIHASYPVVVTRDLDRAKRWVRTKARGNERIGMVASSAAHRLKPHAIDIRYTVDPVHWFLNPEHDPRSSMYLEDAATEFQVQGLELDWACVSWDADLRLARHRWEYHEFRGSRWQRVNKHERRRYLKNAYRVLLTRARQGMAIFVPPGSCEDPTRSPGFYNETFEYLTGLGVQEI